MLGLFKNPKAKIIFILIFAFAIRLVGIASRPIWYDEAFSVLLAEHGPSAILHGTLATDADSSAAEEHPPEYYFVLWAWTQFFGTSIPAARMLSILISLGSIVCVYLIAKHLFDISTAQVAALIAAILPFQVHYAQEIRMYGLLAFWLCLTTLAFLKRQWILFSIAAALAQYTHNLAAFYLIPLALTPVFQRDWKTLRNLTLAGFAAIIIYSPWLIQLPGQISKVTTNFWIERPGIEKLFTLFLLYLPHLPLPNSLLLPGLLFATFIIALAVFQTIQAKRNKTEKANSGIWLAYLSFTPFILLWLISQFWPIYVERALLPSHLIFSIWLAWAFTQTKLPRLIQNFGFILIVITAGIGLYQHVTYNGFSYGPFKALNESIQNRMERGDVIIHSSKLSYLPSFYFDQTLSQSYIIDPPGSNVDTLSPATRDILKLNSYENLEKATANAQRIWFIIYQNSIDEYTSTGNKNHPHLEYLNDNFKLKSIESWNDVRLYLYVRDTP
jgi:4-amino-4-deoxy-L-arabinose transferase-like glycosyltransferase